MTDLLAELQRLGGGGALTAALVFARVGAAMVAMPGFSQGFVPVRIRLAAAIAFTAVILPAVQAMVTPPSAMRWLRA